MRKQLSPRQIFERSITEDDVIGAMRNLLELNGARVHRIVERIPWGRKKSEPGIPDLTGWFYRHPDGPAMYQMPLHFYIEAKRPFKATHRPAQDVWIANAKSDGVIAFFAKSVEEMVQEFMKHGIQLKGGL